MLEEMPTQATVERSDGGLGWLGMRANRTLGPILANTARDNDVWALPVLTPGAQHKTCVVFVSVTNKLGEIHAKQCLYFCDENASDNS